MSHSVNAMLAEAVDLIASKLSSAIVISPELLGRSVSQISETHKEIDGFRKQLSRCSLPRPTRRHCVYYDPGEQQPQPLPRLFQPPGQSAAIGDKIQRLGH